jgi:hypothetical protein
MGGTFSALPALGQHGARPLRRSTTRQWPSPRLRRMRSGVVGMRGAGIYHLPATSEWGT